MVRIKSYYDRMIVKSQDHPAAVAFMYAQKPEKKIYACAFCNDTRHES